MFTGIIEELGKIKSIRRGANQFVIEIIAPELIPGIQVGDSVAVNGICLTATGKTGNSFAVDVMPETVAKTDLSDLKPGQMVNLERALTLASRLGGHMVAGHVDGVGVIRSKSQQKNALIIEISAPESVTRYLIDRGSVAVDGISLTVMDYGPGHVTVSIIPHTAKVTTLGFKGPGDKLNLEADLIGKYVEKFLGKHKESRGRKGAPGDIETRSGLSLERLRENGFA